MQQRHFKNSKNRQGVILIFVMAMIFLISILVTQYIALAIQELQRRGRYAYEGEFRCEAFNLLTLAMAVIQECKTLDSGGYRVTQGWGDPILYSGYALPEGWQATVIVTDESGKLALSAQTDPKVLTALFEELGFNATEATQLTDALLDWMDADDKPRPNGAEADFYKRQKPPYTPPNAPLRSFDELYYITGFRNTFFDTHGDPNTIFKQFVESVSFRRPKGYVNINSASDPLLKALAKIYGIDFSLTKSNLDGPDKEPMTADDRFLKRPSDIGLKEMPKNKAMGFLADFFRVDIWLTHGDVTYRLTAFAQRNTQPKQKPGSKPKATTPKEAFEELQLYWGGIE